MTSAASANSTGKRGEQTGRLDEMSAGSMSLPELLQEPLILRPRSDLRTFWARSCFSSNSTNRARSGGREPGMLRSSLNFLPNTLGVAAWSSICPPTFDQPTRSALARFLTKRGVFPPSRPAVPTSLRAAPCQVSGVALRRHSTKILGLFLSSRAAWRSVGDRFPNLQEGFAAVSLHIDFLRQTLGDAHQIGVWLLLPASHDRAGAVGASKSLSRASTKSSDRRCFAPTGRPFRQLSPAARRLRASACSLGFAGMEPFTLTIWLWMGARFEQTQMLNLGLAECRERLWTIEGDRAAGARASAPTTT